MENRVLVRRFRRLLDEHDFVAAAELMSTRFVGGCRDLQPTAKTTPTTTTACIDAKMAVLPRCGNTSTLRTRYRSSRRDGTLRRRTAARRAPDPAIGARVVWDRGWWVALFRCRMFGLVAWRRQRVFASIRDGD